jgi:hypothetical protein
VKNFYAETKITQSYAQSMRDTVIPDRIDAINYAVRQGLISIELGKRMIRHEQQRDNRFKQWLDGRRS